MTAPVSEHERERRRRNKRNRRDRDKAAGIMRCRTNNHVIHEPDTWRARVAEIPVDTRSLTARLCGDPLPGRSARDREGAHG